MPSIDDDKLSRIYDRTSGKCHICRKQLSFNNYGVHGARGAWHVDHSVARARGGSDHGNNLFAACIGCNLEKSTTSTRAVRARNGHSRAPLSRAKREQAEAANTIGGGVIGAGVGGILAGPPGALLGGLIGSLIGSEMNADE